MSYIREKIILYLLLNVKHFCVVINFFVSPGVSMSESYGRATRFLCLKQFEK